MSPFTEKRFLPRQALGHEERERLIKAITERLSKEQDIVFAYVHGSFATTEPFRDIDIAVYTGGRKGFDFESDLSYELSTLTKYEVEVRAIDNAPVAFQMAALQNGKLLFSKDENARTDFMEAVGRRYPEYAHFRNIFMEAVGAKR